MLKRGCIVALDSTKALLARTGGSLEEAFVHIMNTPDHYSLEAQA
jgi:hypothetical protein